MKFYEDDYWRMTFDSFLTDLKECVGYEASSLFVFEQESQSLREVASSGDGIDFISSVNFPLGKGLSAWVAQKGKLIYLADIHRGSRHGFNPIRSYLSMPLEQNGKIVGVLNLSHVKPKAFSGKKMQKIEALAKQITRKIYNRIYLNFIPDDEKNITYR